MNKQEEYMLKVRTVHCSIYDNCTIKNVVNCRRCLTNKKQLKETLGDLFQGLGLNEKAIDDVLTSSQSMISSVLPQARSNRYWCFECKRRHLLNSKVGKDHLTLEGN